LKEVFANYRPCLTLIGFTASIDKWWGKQEEQIDGSIENSGSFFRSHRHELPVTLALSPIVSRAADRPKHSVYGCLAILFIMMEKGTAFHFPDIYVGRAYGDVLISLTSCSLFKLMETL
jgi:hypothetical protein